MSFAVRRLAPVLLLAAVGSIVGGSIAGAEDTLSTGDRARALIERIRRGDPPARDEAVRGLLDLAEIEDGKPSAARPVHEVLKGALTDPDAEVRFRVRRVLADPEVRVERLLGSLLEPMQTEAVRQTLGALTGDGVRGVARAGLIRVARRAAEAGFDPLTSKLNETWHPWGLEGGARLKLVRRFHVAVDLLADARSDEEALPVCDLLREDLGDSLADVIDALAARPGVVREWCRKNLHDASAITRENAACALGELGTAEDAAALDSALNDPEPRVRRAVVSAFELLPVDDAACVAAAGHANDPDPRVAVAALHLGALRGQRFVTDPAKKILAAQSPEAPSETRIQAMRALARFGDPDGTLRGVAQKAIEARTAPGDARYAAWAAGAAGDQEALPVFEKLLEREDFALETGVYYAIARAGATGWLDRLVQLQHDDARRFAIQALGSARGDAEKIAEALQKTAQRAVEREGGADWNDFLTAFRALRDRGDAPSRKAMSVLLDQALVNAMRGTGVDDQTLALFVEYATQARATTCLRGLQTILRTNRSQYVRELAMEAITTIDPRRAREILTPLLESGRLNVEEIEVISRSLSRAGDLPRGQRAIEIAKAKVAQAVNGTGRESFPQAINTLGIEHAYGGELPQAILCYRRLRWLQPDSNMGSYNIACVLAIGGDKEGALRWFRRSVREGFKNWRHIKGDPDLTCLYDDPRFVRIVEELRQLQEVEPAIEPR